MYKLDYYGIIGSAYKWINSWFSERSQKDVLDAQASDPVLSGVPKGSVLGQVLFLIFIIDLPENIRSSVRLFADDCVMYRNMKSPNDCLAQWDTDWQMKLNVAKCHSMRVTRHLPDIRIQFGHSFHINKNWNRFSTQNILEIKLEYLSQTIEIGVNMFQRSRVKQLRQRVFFSTILHWHLGTLRKLHTKHWFALTRVCSSHLTSLSRNSDCTCGEGAEDNCQMDLQAMEKYK